MPFFPKTCRRCGLVKFHHFHLMKIEQHRDIFSILFIQVFIGLFIKLVQVYFLLMDEETKSVLATLTATLSNITNRLEILETGQSGHRTTTTGDHVPAAISNPTVVQDVNGDYNALKASLASLKIPQSLQVPTDKTGIRKSDQPAHNLILKVGRYTETIIKIIQSPMYDVPDQRLSDVLTTTTALIECLQEEAAALIVQGTFDEGVSKFFCSLQRSSTFSPDALDNLRAAASIAAVYRPQQRGRGGSGAGGFQRGGFHRGGFRRRGGRGSGPAPAFSPEQADS